MGERTRLMEALYYKDEKVRKEIDELLHQNAIIESNLGIDSTDEERELAEFKQNKLFLKIKEIDLEFYKIIVTEDKRP